MILMIITTKYGKSATISMKTLETLKSETLIFKSLKTHMTNIYKKSEIFDNFEVHGSPDIVYFPLSFKIEDKPAELSNKTSQSFYFLWLYKMKLVGLFLVN